MVIYFFKRNLIIKSIIFFILCLLNVKANSFDVFLDVGYWSFKERYGLFSVKQKIVERCRKPRHSYGIITYLDCPYVILKNEKSIKVYPQHLELDPFKKIEFKIILRIPKEKKEIFFGIGTQFTHFQLNGRKFEILSQEQGNGRGKQPITFLQRLIRPGLEGNTTTTYAASPIVYSNLYSYVFNNYSYAQANFKHRKYNEYSFLTRNLEYSIETASNWKELIEKTTNHTGRMRLLPDWIQEGAIVGLMGGKKVLKSV